MYSAPTSYSDPMAGVSHLLLLTGCPQWLIEPVLGGYLFSGSGAFVFLSSYGVWGCVQHAYASDTEETAGWDLYLFIEITTAWLGSLWEGAYGTVAHSLDTCTSCVP